MPPNLGCDVNPVQEAAARSAAPALPPAAAAGPSIEPDRLRRARLYYAAWEKRGKPGGWFSSHARRAAEDDFSGHKLLQAASDRTARDAWSLAKTLG
jgi:hypothetical protein